jgi:osmotically-inducible protein OsmY
MFDANFKKTSLITSILVLFLAACSIFSGQETTGQYVDDATITTKVKEALISDPQVHASQIHVETLQGTVQLSGFSDSAKSEARAVELTRQVRGVKSIKDNIIVRTPPP